MNDLTSDGADRIYTIARYEQLEGLRYGLMCGVQQVGVSLERIFAVQGFYPVSDLTQLLSAEGYDLRDSDIVRSTRGISRRTVEAVRFPDGDMPITYLSYFPSGEEGARLLRAFINAMPKDNPSGIRMSRGAKTN